MKKMKSHSVLRALALLLCLLDQKALAKCLSTISGQVALNIKHCRTLTPATALPRDNAQVSSINDLPLPQRNAVFASYRGSLLKAQVTHSTAKQSGLSEDEGALKGEVEDFFIPANEGDCSKFSGGTLQATLTEACCDGPATAPCLLETRYVLKNTRILTKGGVNSGKSKLSPELQAAYRQALQKIAKRDCKGGAVLMEKIRAEDLLDAQGEYLIAACYREIDRCPLALRSLKKLNQLFESNKYWVESENYVRRGNLLYARCLSKLNKPSDATLVLQGFLVEPKKYRAEIQASMNHPDFGYIRSTKAYADYLSSAAKALSNH